MSAIKLKWFVYSLLDYANTINVKSVVDGEKHKGPNVSFD
jgi:hypothetical protein